MSSEPFLVTAAVVMKPDGTLLLARRPVGDKLAGHWELPGRKVDVGESPGGCLAQSLSGGEPGLSLRAEVQP